MDSIQQKIAFIIYCGPGPVLGSPKRNQREQDTVHVLKDVAKDVIKSRVLRGDCPGLSRLVPNAITCIFRRHAHGGEDRQRRQHEDRTKRWSHKPGNPDGPWEWEEARNEPSPEPARGVWSCRHLHFSSRKLTSDSGFQICQRIDFCCLKPPSCGHVIQ